MILIVVASSNFVLCEEDNAGCETIIEVFENSGLEWSIPVKQGETWDRDPVPFHAILQFEKEGLKAIDDLPEVEI